MPDTLFTRLRRCIACLQHRYRMSAEEATDVVCEALAACLHYLRSLHPEEPPDVLLRYMEPGLLESIVQKRVADYYRRQAREQRAIKECLKQLPAVDPDQQALTLLLVDEIWNALPNNCRQVVYLRIYEQCSWEEIAQAIGISVSAAKMRFQRGIAQARKNLGVTCDESPLSNDLSSENLSAGENADAAKGGESGDAATDLPREHRPRAGNGEPGDIAHHRRQHRARGGGGVQLPSNKGCGCDKSAVYVVRRTTAHNGSVPRLTQTTVDCRGCRKTYNDPNNRWCIASLPCGTNPQTYRQGRKIPEWLV
ncbi:MAG: sigma-70 family RNA polymerase sigma factor [Armatimonadota bacterium]|nr:sigma-70 family RNA polymerase sigma factor [bacterium]MDW8321609.1 sigma-70 family RNA polymerase sigma factor [Armatimonadota bacterium]